jgi:hypothetical protein
MLRTIHTHNATTHVDQSFVDANYPPKAWKPYELMPLFPNHLKARPNLKRKVALPFIDINEVDLPCPEGKI